MNLAVHRISDPASKFFFPVKNDLWKAQTSDPKTLSAAAKVLISELQSSLALEKSMMGEIGDLNVQDLGI